MLASRDGTLTRYYAHAGGRPALLGFADEACVARLDAFAEGLTAIGDASRNSLKPRLPANCCWQAVAALGRLVRLATRIVEASAAGTTRRAVASEN